MGILVFIKSIPYARSAVLYAGMLSRLTGSSMTLLAARERGADPAAVERTLEQAADLLSDMPVSRHTRVGSAVQSIRDEIQEGSYDLVVLQARRAIRYRQRLGMKIGRLVAVESPISVLVVKDSEHEVSLKNILVCTGGREQANIVIERAADLAAVAGANITLLHVATPVPTMYTGMDEMDERFEDLLQTDTPTARHLREAAKMLAERDIPAHLEIRRGEITDEIMRESEAGDYGLIVIGSSPADSRIRGWIMGDVPRNLVNHASCPVLVAR